MTKQECAVIQAYTGVCMLQSDDTGIFYSYINNLFGRPVFTHEIPDMADEIKEKSKNDFVALCESAVDLDAVLEDMWDLIESGEDEESDTEGEENV